MNDLLIKSTKVSPKIKLSHSTGEMEIRGRFLVMSGQEFYKDVVTWVNQYSVSPHKSTRCDFYLDYTTADSYKCVFLILKSLQCAVNKGMTELVVNWHYNNLDDESLEIIEDVVSVLNLPINLIPEEF